jgi:hypothetical protein
MQAFIFLIFITPQSKSMNALDQITTLMQSVSISSSTPAINGSTIDPSSSETRASSPGKRIYDLQDSPQPRDSGSSDQDVMLESVRMCAAFAKATTLLDQIDSESGTCDSTSCYPLLHDSSGDTDVNTGHLAELLQNTTSMIRVTLPLFRQRDRLSDRRIDTLQRETVKVEKAFERLRRAAVKVVEAKGVTAETQGDKEPVKLLLIAIVDAAKADLTAVCVFLHLVEDRTHFFSEIRD